MSRLDERGVGEAVRVAGEDAGDIGSETDAIGIELPGERDRYGVARADGESEPAIGHHLSVEERYPSLFESYGDGIGSEAGDPALALDDDGGGVDRNDRESGCDQYLCDGGIESLVRALGSECRIDLQGIGTGAMAEIEIVGELMAGGSGTVDEDEPAGPLIDGSTYRKRYPLEERGAYRKSGAVLVGRDTAADLENDEGWVGSHSSDHIRNDTWKKTILPSERSIFLQKRLRFA